MTATLSTANTQTLGIPATKGLAEAGNSPATEMETDDHAVMLAVREGDTHRLGELFERHHRPLYGFFVRLTNQRSSSEDLVQQVFYRILKYRHSYRDEGNFRTWMYHLARKVAADFYQKSSRTPAPILDPEQWNALPDHGPHAAQQVEHKDNLALMRKALEGLPAEERELIVLHRFQHLPHEEMARLHSCTTGAMKVRLHRAVQSLREHFFRLSKTSWKGEPAS